MHIVLAVTFYTVVFVATSLQLSEPNKNVFGRCILPLGMEEGKIPDDAITASSSYEMKSVGPQNARIRQEKNGGAWCPKAQISSAIREYLEVDLTKDHLIAWTETQGRFGNGQGQEYAEAFFLEYFRDGKWHQYKNLKGESVLRGNSNTYLPEKQKLDLPFVASRVRFVPYSQHPRTVCMRVEIYGCVWEQHVASYSGPKGSQIGPDGSNVEDSSYDGAELDGFLMYGLGQLTDGILGENTEILDPSIGGTNWVGWTDCESVELIFEFEELREFDNCSIHVADIPERNIEIFSTVRLWFSIDGKKYQQDSERLNITMENRSGTGVRFIPLQSRLAKFVKLEFTLSGQWLLLSEITFESVSGIKNLASDDSAEGSIGTQKNESESRSDLSGIRLPGLNETIYDEPSKDNTTPNAFPVGSSQTYIGLVSGLLTMIVLFLTCTAFLMKQRGRNKVALLQKHTALLCSSSAPGITINPKDVKLPNHVVVNGMTQSRLSLKGKTSGSDSESTSRPTEIPPTGTSSNQQIYERSTIYHSTYTLFTEENRNRNTNPSNREADYSDPKSHSSFSKDKLTESTIPTPYQSRRSSHFQSGRTQQKVHEGYYAATDILTIKKREQPTTVSLFTPLRIASEKDVCSSRSCEPYDIQRVSRHRLRIVDKLGEGSFGLVHLCEAKGLQNPDLGSIQNRQIVIVRSLWRGVVDSLRKDFTRDMYALSTIRDPNIARMIALVEEEPFGAVFEYGQLGDLPSFLEQHENTGGKDIPISYAYRLNFSAQIASGMKYLESSNIAHCDLAARNCIVGQNLTVKVSDHAMYCNKYDRQYYMDGHYAKIPLRWMSWEAGLLDNRSSRGDVWSYAVTVWEILMSCKELPYSDLTSEQVLENLSRWYRTDSSSQQPQILPKPSCCPDDLYRMMTKCWSKEPEDRPTFEEIYLYLERLGFD